MLRCSEVLRLSAPHYRGCAMLRAHPIPMAYFLPKRAVTQVTLTDGPGFCSKFRPAVARLQRTPVCAARALDRDERQLCRGCTRRPARRALESTTPSAAPRGAIPDVALRPALPFHLLRSEERRVGKECRTRRTRIPT